MIMLTHSVPGTAIAAVRRCAPIAALLVALTAAPLDAQITRHPTGVNVNATGPTAVFITFGNLGGKVPIEATWCGEIESAAPAIGMRCVPATLYGRLPIRYDRSRYSGPSLASAAPPPTASDPLTRRASLAPRQQVPGTSLAGDPRAAVTDVMTIPASVARRAYQAAVRGEDSRFYYVRRFVDPLGGPDEYVVVTCRLTDGGARTPFALNDVRISFETGDPVLAAQLGETLPALSAVIHYNGTGRLRGRWELVRPGEELPEDDDLLTEATLPTEARRTQRRYTEIQRFDVFLPPGGPFTLDGPSPERLSTDAPGMHLLLLRIEASDDKEGESNLTSAGAGAGIVAAGGVAGFAIPPLRYFVGELAAVGTAAEAFALLAPAADAPLASRGQIFRWRAHPHATFTRIELASTDSVLVEAVLPRGTSEYAAPPLALLRGTATRWRAVALGANGRALQETPWRSLRPPAVP